jgi:hypothetical protein
VLAGVESGDDRVHDARHAVTAFIGGHMSSINLKLAPE